MLNTIDLNSQVFPYILNAIDGEGYERSFTNDTEKLQFLADTFKSEYVCQYNLKNDGSYLSMFKNWIQGLPSCFNIAFQYCDIIKLAKEWGSLNNNPTEKEIDKILNNWFNLVANKTFQLMKKYKVLPY